VGPYYAECLAGFLTSGEPLPREVDIARFAGRAP